MPQPIPSHYREFLELFYIFLRDFLVKNPCKGHRRRRQFSAAVELCFEFYRKSNIGLKYSRGSAADDVEAIIDGIRRLFYYDFNLIYYILQEDVNLIVDASLAGRLRRSIQSFFSMFNPDHIIR
jgi:hypothetical protein